MPQEKQTSPLPVGRYWIQVEKANYDDWFQWTKDMGESVTVTMTEESPDHLFTIFEVSDNAAFFPPERFGYPNKAPKKVNSESDVVQVPIDDTPTTEDALKFLKTAGKVAAGLFIAKLAVDLLRKN